MHLQKTGRMNNIGIFTTLSNILLKILKLFKVNNIHYLGGGGQRLTKKSKMTIDPFRILCCQGKEEKKGQQKGERGRGKSRII